MLKTSPPNNTGAENYLHRYFESNTPQQAAGYLILAAFAKWMLTHPLGSLLAEINSLIALSAFP